MGQINLLSKQVFTRIAAGEVVDRPYSVFKELVENSIDALASRVKVNVIDGGVTSIIVTDDGDGMDREDLEKCILPHATSKIHSIEDIDVINSYGFRGEALPSIASVSKMTICSKTEHQEIGNQLKIEGGIPVGVEECAMSRGTKIVVNNLFYNTPAREKYLKSSRSEANEISAMMARFILSNPYVAFTYEIDGSIVFQSFGDGLDSAFAAVYGTQLLNHCFFINTEINGIRIVGYAGKHFLAKNNRSFQTVFINGRYIENKIISSAINTAYAPYMMKHKFPFCVLNLKLPDGTYDVNVTPSKTDVRFLSNRTIFSAVHSTLTRVLDGTSEALNIVKGEDCFSEEISKSIPNQFLTYDERMKRYIKEQKKIFKNQSQIQQTVEVEQEKTNKESISFCDGSPKYYKDCPTTNEKAYQMGLLHLEKVYFDNQQYLEEVNKDKNPLVDKSTADYLIEHYSKQDARIKDADPEPEEQVEGQQERPYKIVTRYSPEVESIIESRKTRVKYIGQVFSTYIIVQERDDMYLIDQHAAHERIIYDKLIASLKRGVVARQPLIVPYTLNLSYDEFEFISSKVDNLRDLGVDMELFGRNSFKVTSVPTCIGEMKLDDFFSNILKNLKDMRGIVIEEIMMEKLAKEACTSAIKAGYSLSNSDRDYIIDQLKDNKGLKCPHGRPVCVKVSKTEIEKWFKRIV